MNGPSYYESNYLDDDDDHDAAVEVAVQRMRQSHHEVVGRIGRVPNVVVPWWTTMKMGPILPSWNTNVVDWW